MSTCPSCATTPNCSENPITSGSSCKRFKEVTLAFNTVRSLNMLNRFTVSSARLEHCVLPFRQYEESQCSRCKISTNLGSSGGCCKNFKGLGTLKFTMCKSHGKEAARGEKDLGGGFTDLSCEILASTVRWKTTFITRLSITPWPRPRPSSLTNRRFISNYHFPIIEILAKKLNMIFLFNSKPLDCTLSAIYSGAMRNGRIFPSCPWIRVYFLHQRALRDQQLPTFFNNGLGIAAGLEQEQKLPSKVDASRSGKIWLRMQLQLESTTVTSGLSTTIITTSSLENPIANFSQCDLRQQPSTKATIISVARSVCSSTLSTALKKGRET
ncbi:hypothetical protein CR513_45499, partial [Mucuna pruriens]